jgi:hypothetical protein
MNLGFKDYITTKALATDFKRPIIARELASETAARFDVPLVKARNAVNVYLKQLTDIGVIARVHKGVYGVVKKTAFGDVLYPQEALIAETLIHDGADTIGYETGASIINKLGMSTQIPVRRTIATNRYRTVLPENLLLELTKPITRVTTDNAKYLQMLEIITTYRRYPIDASNPEEIIHAAIGRQGLDVDKLIWFACQHLNDKVLRVSIELILGRRAYNEAA